MVKTKEGRVKKHGKVGPPQLSIQSTFDRPSDPTQPYECKHRLLFSGADTVVMRTMEHRDVKTVMCYQHPELEIMRCARLRHDER